MVAAPTLAGPSSARRHPLPHPAVPPPTILLVDAHEDSRYIYAAALVHYGFRVVECDGNARALEMACTHQPQLIVLAVSLSSAPAWGVLTALREHPDTSAIPVLAVSTTGLSEHRALALQMGCAGFLVKPLPPMELLAAARQVLGQAA